MADLDPKSTWPAAVSLLAEEVGEALPEPTQRGMGIVEWRNDSGKRFVAFRPVYKAPANRDTARARWTLWHDAGDQSRPALVLHLPLRPSVEMARQLVSLIDGWLAHDWTDQEAQQKAEVFADVEVPLPTTKPEVNKYELCEQGGFQITVEADKWFIQLGRKKRFTAWKSKVGDLRGDSLPLAQLDRLCGWLAKNWDAVAYGKHPRPASLREHRGVSACRAYKFAYGEANPAARSDLESWWQRHAFRAADPELPNIFLERQGDEVIFSWDDAPSQAKLFLIFEDMQTTAAGFAIPALRQFVTSRFDRAKGVEPKFKKRMTELDSEEGFRAVRSTIDNLTDQWLIDRQFDPEDARELARTGTTMHPVVGLLRSAQGSSLSLDDLDAVLDKLQPNAGNRFQKLREIAKSMDAHIDLREPWESGYHLARQVRAELGQKETGYFDIETAVKDLGVEVCDLSLTDPSIQAVCVGSLQYGPLIAINVAHPDAEDPSASGRRISLAHELCHLLFDRKRMRGFARFEGGAAESDRLIEMRANAFAVELLAPIESFRNPDSTWMSEEEGVALSASLQVSKVAISQHLRNHTRPTHDYI